MVAAARPVTDVTPKLVIILMNPAARRAVPVIPDVLAALIPFLTVAAVPVQNVLPAVTHLLLTGALIMEHAMVTVAKTVLGIHVMNVAEALDAAEEADREVLAHLMIAVVLVKDLMRRMMFISVAATEGLFLAIGQERVVQDAFLPIITADVTAGRNVASNYFCSNAETISSVTFLASP